MLLLDFLTHRRKELLDFFSWRFGTPHWMGPCCYCTGIPRYALTKLLKGGDKRGGTLTVSDFARAEDAARHLGFQPTYPNLTGYQLSKPPPASLPKWSDPEVQVRFKQWQRETRAGAMNVNPIRKRERKAYGPKPSDPLGKNSLFGDTHTVVVKKSQPSDTVVKSSHSDELKNNGSNNIEATQAINPLLVNDPSV